MEKEEYEKSIFEYEDVQDAIACAREDGVEEGFEQGLEQGVIKGRIEGLSEAKRQLVRNMLAYGMDVKTISESTGLTHEEILGMQ